LEAVKQSIISSFKALPDLPLALVAQSKLSTEDETALSAVTDARYVQSDLNERSIKKLDKWVVQVEGLIAEMRYGRQRGKRGILPPKKEDGQAVVLHRVVGGNLDVFTSVNQAAFGQEHIKALGKGMFILPKLPAQAKQCVKQSKTRILSFYQRRNRCRYMASEQCN